MKIATLQFSPVLGRVEDNISTADSLLQPTHAIDLLVLPELAFTGYNFASLAAIQPYLEPTTAGRTTEWAVGTAKRCACYVVVGYPERATDSQGRAIEYAPGRTRNYNSVVTVSPRGEVVANYRKSFLYYTDETWAAEGTTSPSSSSCFSSPSSPAAQSSPPFFTAALPELGTVGLGICMDINPYRFTAPWEAYEFANRMLAAKTKLVILSMAWLTRLLPEEVEAEAQSPDMETVAYWLERFHPFVDQSPADHQQEIIVVFANRCGLEGNKTGSVEVENGSEVEAGDRVCYAGSSCVMRFQGGNVRMFERKKGGGVAVMGKGEEGVLVVDTAEQARFLLQHKAGLR